MGSQIAAPAAAGAHPVETSHTAPIPVPLTPDAEAALAPVAEAALAEVGAAVDRLALAHDVHAVPQHSPIPEQAPIPSPPPHPEITPAQETVAAPAADATVVPPITASSWLPQPLAVAPVAGTVTSAFGPRWGTTHAGLDIANSIGTPVYAAAAGTVINSGPASGFGLWVQIRHDDGSTSTYGHINETLVTVGQQVQAGEQIATVGNRGESTGPHLHFETTNPDGTKVDPIQWLAARGVAQTDLSRM
ncbi:M23 family metallopeptidase [Rhodococcus pyridinivorans]|uniref:M23 family metallopeptidase n=1 Tax=Rhodococcus pyridinivorans TaxID=103816 RepID=UPI00228331FD|nr:M23 family metallopeptidase [Rhodococcus pyridinivorans]